MGLIFPAYARIGSGEVLRRSRQLAEMASPCRLCPRSCGVLRSEGKTGYCRTPLAPMVSSAHPHFGEEGPLSGTRGSGTIFFTNCNLGCIFCQNYDISHLGSGTVVSVQDLARVMVLLQRQGCHNINFVTPTHQVHAITAALSLAMEEGLSVPLVYNTGGYDSVDTLAILDGIVDIYMPDFKFSDPSAAEDLAEAPDYPKVARAAIREMHRQVGDLVLDENGVARRGLLVRHLVLPHDLAGSAEAFRFLAEEISTNTYVNVMAQYRPCWRAAEHAGASDRLRQADYLRAVSMAREAGLKRLD